MKNDEIDLIALCQTLWCNKKTLFIALFIALFISAIYLSLAPKKYTSTAILSAPTLGELTNYPAATQLVIANNAQEYSPELPHNVFRLYLSYMQAYINNEKQNPRLAISKEKDTNNIIVTFSASTPTIAQSELTALLAQFNQKTQKKLFTTVNEALSTQRNTVQLYLNAHEKIAKIKAAQRLSQLESALSVANTLNVQTNNIQQLPETLPPETLFMLGAPALNALIHQQPPNFEALLNDDYFDYQAWFIALSSFELQEADFQAAMLIAPPSLAEHPDSPKSGLIIILAMILGLLVGGGYILLRQAFPQKQTCQLRGKSCEK